MLHKACLKGVFRSIHNVEISCIDSHQTEFVGKGSDHLQLIRIWPPRAPGKGVCGGAKTFGFALQQPARSVCAPLSAFSLYLQHSHCTLNCTQSFNGGETPWMSYDVTNPPITQIHPSIEADIDWFTTTAARRYMDQCTLYSTVDSFLNIDILNNNPVILEPYK